MPRREIFCLAVEDVKKSIFTRYKSCDRRAPSRDLHSPVGAKSRRKIAVVLSFESNYYYYYY